MPTSDRELAVLIDVSRAANSAHACQRVEDFIAEFRPEGGLSPGRSTAIDLNAGNLLLTRGVLSRIHQMLRKNNFRLSAVFSTVPQTQQAALDEGFYVKGAWTGEAESLGHEFLSSGGIQKPYATLGEALASLNVPEAQPSPKTGFSMQVEPADRKPVTETTAAHAPATPEPPQEMDSSETTLEESLLEESDPTVPMQDIVPTDVTLATLYLKQTLRSGQMIRYNGNVVLVGDAHAGSEITATGDITVWGELRGIAHAGSEGNYRAEIRAMKIEALQLRISEYIARRPDRIYYHKPADATLPAPELAKVADGEIKVFKDQVY